MTLTKGEKSALIQRFKTHQTDCGSSEVQIALLTKRIDELTAHFRVHSKDHHSRRGLMRLVGQRRRLLRYLNRRDPEGYRKIIKDLKLRR